MRTQPCVHGCVQTAVIVGGNVADRRRHVRSKDRLQLFKALHPKMFLASFKRDKGHLRTTGDDPVERG